MTCRLPIRPIPFTAGEATSYRVKWTSGPLGLAAGQATISVVPPQNGAGFAFRVDASTAPWMSRIYEAIVRLESATTASLLPLAYREVIDEGTRGIERQLTFDPERHEVRIVSGGTSIVLPCRDWGARSDQRVLLPAHAGAHGRRPVRHSNQRQRAPAAPRCHRGAA